MDRVFLASGAVFAFLAVGAGAFGAHALRKRIPPERLQTFETATRYTMYHALGLFAVVWFRTLGPIRSPRRWRGSRSSWVSWCSVGAS